MNKIFFAAITSVLFLNLFFSSNKDVNTENSVIYSLIEASGGVILETSVKAIYFVEESAECEIKEVEEYIQGDILSFNREADNIFVLKILKDEALIEVKGVDLTDKSQITIKTTVYGDSKTLRELEQFIQVYTKNKEVEAKYYKYMKGKLRNKKIDESLENINSTLKKQGFNSIESLEIENGYTSIAVFNDGLLKDKMKINYSLCSYETCTYIFIGTPIIDEIY